MFKNILCIERVFDLNECKTTKRVLNVLFLFCFIHVFYLYLIKIVFPLELPDVNYIKSQEIFKVAIICAAYSLVVYLSVNFTSEQKVKYKYIWNLMLSYVAFILIPLLLVNVVIKSFSLFYDVNHNLPIEVNNTTISIIYPVWFFLVIIHAKRVFFDKSHWNFWGFVVLFITLKGVVPQVFMYVDIKYSIYASSSVQMSVTNFFKMIDGLLPI